MNDSTIGANPAATLAGRDQRYLLLDGLRGLAAFAVILDHVPGGWLGDALPGRYLAVDFFFVLSGFVLAHAYGERLAAGWPPLAFMKARLIRLYPMYLVGLVIGLAISLIGLWRGWEGIAPADVALVAVCSLLFLPSPPTATYSDGALYPFNGPAWSLFFELVANLVYACIARFLTWRVLGAILVISAVAVVFTIARHAGVGGPGWLWQHADAGLARVMFDFFAGVALFRLGRTLRVRVPWWIAPLGLIAVFAIPATGDWRVAFDIVAALILMPALVALASGSQVSGWLAGACDTLGRLSYGVYIIHVPLFAMLGVAASAFRVQLPEGPMLALGVALLAAIIVAVLDRAYDRPVRRWVSGGSKGDKLRNVAGEGG